MQHKLSVHALIEAVVREGDINFRFSQRSTALEGIRGHQQVQKRRGEHYQSEVVVNWERHDQGIHLILGGRIDGVFRDSQPLLVEEIKTSRIPAAEIPAGVMARHWAQVKLYTWMWVQQEAAQVAQVQLRLCFFNPDSKEEEYLDQSLSLSALMADCEVLVSAYFEQVLAWRNWRDHRDESIAVLRIPYESFRPSQREFAVNSYRALTQDQQLVLQAPTGTGKTLGAIFPAIKALRDSGYDKMFFLTAKTVGREVAEKTVQQLGEQGLALRLITLTAKDKVCFNPGSPCDPEHCEFAAGYYDRVGAAVTEVLQTQQATRPVIEAAARNHTVCPFELSLDVSRWSDIVVCDYNYVFDPVVYLRRFFEEIKGRYGLLVDEAHNLVDRGRSMFSAELAKASFLELRREVKGPLPHLGKKLAAINRVFLELRHLDQPVLDTPPEKLISRLRDFCQSAEEFLQQNLQTSYQPAILQLYFDSLRFLRTAEEFDHDYRCLTRRDKQAETISLYCLNPATRLGRGLSRVTGAILFSATLTPARYYQQLLGVVEGAHWFALSNPFPPENLGVFLADHVGTTWRTRRDSRSELISLITTVVSARRGNYAVYFPSYQYLQDTLAEMPSLDETLILAQQPNMSEQERLDWINAFHLTADEESSVLGFAVMGGIFGEGIDLQGEALIGVIIVGTGLPQLGLERDQIRDYFDKILGPGQGYGFAYQFPGWLRVLQTAGRVIRTEQDRGVVCLVDDRFLRPAYQQLFPATWAPVHVSSDEQLGESIDQFWGNHSI